MTTATEIIAEALGNLGLVAGGEAVSGNDGLLCLSILNTLVDAWNLPSDFAYTTLDISATLNAGVGSLTIGPAQQLACTRPGRIEIGSYVRLNSVDFDMQGLTQEQWNLIPYKTNQGSVPRWFWYNNGVSTGVVYYYPVPVVACVVHHVVQLQTAAFADLTTNYVMPQGLKRAFVYNLAVEAGPHFEREAPPSVIRSAANSLRAYKNNNTNVPTLRIDSAIPQGRARGGSGWYY